MELFRIEQLCFTYPEREEPALDSVSLSIQEGDFLVLMGESGCGKSTLLRHLKTAFTPYGTRNGRILFHGKPLEEWSKREQSSRIGLIQQSPESQIVTDKVWHELAFGLESLGYSTAEIRSRVAEIAEFFGIQSWYYKKTAELSGGQKQLLNLASVMVLQPEVLILDEPAGQLDPIAASGFLDAVKKINRELGTTVIVSEHRLEEIMPLSNRVAVMETGKICKEGAPQEIGEWMIGNENRLNGGMPVAMRVWSAVEADREMTGNPAEQECPLSVRDGRRWLSRYAQQHPLFPLAAEQNRPDREQGKEEIILVREVWFRYGKNEPDTIKSLSFSLRKGEIFALLGGNGTGKTTALKLMAGLLKPQRGRITVSGKVGFLPQDPQLLFGKKTVEEDLFELFGGESRANGEQKRLVKRAVDTCGLEGLLTRHPYDLSGGEQQKLAIAKVLLSEPEILLLDEPTKGLDYAGKEIIAALVQELALRGMTVVLVSHDVEFCAKHADRCGLFFDGAITAEGTPREFFGRNRFYTTAACRMAREIVTGAITAEDIVFACRGKGSNAGQEENEDSGRQGTEHTWGEEDQNKGESVFSENTGEPKAERKAERPRKQHPAGKKALSVGIPALLIPLTLAASVIFLENTRYYFVSFVLLLEILIPFFLLFEGRKPRSREIVVIAVLCALGVVGRAAFYMLPECKPVVAVAVIAGVALGSQTGFLVGSLTMLISNILFFQGPWTPWQMIAVGLIGFLAGAFRRLGWLKERRLALCIFGFLSSLLIYGGIMNPASALLWMRELNPGILLTYYISGFPMDLVLAFATWIFLWFAGEPVLEKLERVKMKYGLYT